MDYFFSGVVGNNLTLDSRFFRLYFGDVEQRDSRRADHRRLFMGDIWG